MSCKKVPSQQYDLLIRQIWELQLPWYVYERVREVRERETRRKGEKKERGWSKMSETYFSLFEFEMRHPESSKIILLTTLILYFIFLLYFYKKKKDTRFQYSNSVPWSHRLPWKPGTVEQSQIPETRVT